MSYQLDRLSPSPTLSPETLRGRIERLLSLDRPRFARLWAYYRNPMLPPAVADAARPYRQAQEWGLPSRITGVRAGSEVGSAVPVDDVARKEVVIENDIGWRVDTCVDYLFGKPVVVRSAAPDPARRELITRLLRAILARNGGILLLQQLALLSAVYGFVDVLVKFDPSPADDGAVDPMPLGGDEHVPADPAPFSPDTRDSTQAPPDAPDATASAGAPGDESASTAEPAPQATVSPAPSPARPNDPGEPVATMQSPDAILRAARLIRLEIVPPARALPLLCPTDYRTVEAYAQVYQLSAPAEPAPEPQAQPLTWRSLLRRSADFLRGAGRRADSPRVTRVVEIISAHRWQRYEDERLVAEGVNSLGQIPLVHIQNTAEPFSDAGESDVEILIPLQDELNTRLCDRANRIALQSFKMYLGKGIDNFIEAPISPGRM